ncbi:MAG: nickel ABC transporter ATP-binding protein [Chloroflexota bacterium]
MPLFEVKEVSYVYAGRFIALDRVSLSIWPGERVAILGANGSGKSTLLKLLDGLYFPTQGEVHFQGRLLSEAAFEDEDFAFDFRRCVSLIFQDADIQLFSPTVWDEVAFGPLQLGLSRDEVIARTQAALAALGIARLRERTPYQLSGGEKRKVAIASVLSLGPEVWLMDEPTAGLDPRSQSWLVDFICQEGERGHTVVTATQDLDIVADIADRVLVFSEDHRLVAEGTPVDILSDRALLLRCNLIHEHRHRHAEMEHAHLHVHTGEHRHD